MSTDATTTELTPRRPKRADARRNYDALIAAAREAFTQDDADASLEGVARRAGVGIGTLYRHFPTRKDLLAAVYEEEVQAICQSAEEFTGLPPWDALVGWLRRFTEYAVTKHALMDALMSYVDRDDPVFRSCRVAINTTGGELLARAKASGDVRPDAEFTDVGRMVAGIATIRGAEPEQIDRILELALDGLRYRA